MSVRATRLAARSAIFSFIVLAGLFGYGCGGGKNGSSISVQFTPSSTAPAVDLVKLIPKASSDQHLALDVVIGGPDASLDLYSFAFDVVIGDPSIVKFVSGSALAGNALVAGTGQTINVVAGPDSSDPSHIVVGVSKAGGGAGNGISGVSAVVVELVFDAQKAGATTLAIASSPAPKALDSSLAPIPAVTFDTATGSYVAVFSGGGY